ncbi:MAG: hypothetical protein ACLVHV_13795 [Oscillospiraceae bacterium]
MSQRWLLAPGLASFFAATGPLDSQTPAEHETSVSCMVCFDPIPALASCYTAAEMVELNLLNQGSQTVDPRRHRWQRRRRTPVGAGEVAQHEFMVAACFSTERVRAAVNIRFVPDLDCTAILFGR